MDHPIRLVMLICACLLITRGQAQINLVRNASFEQYSQCPDMIDEAKYATGWSGLDTVWSPPDWAHAIFGVPEYCNVCATYPDVRVPLFGTRFPRTGDGMMQLGIFYDETDSGTQTRDYLQGHLNSTLKAGHNYRVSFFTTLEQSSHYAINHIAAYLDNGTIDTTSTPGRIQNQYTPQIDDTAIINDTLHWINIAGTFGANGNERFITIGNFYDISRTHFVAVLDTSLRIFAGGFWAYYLIDDVSVIDCDNIPFAGHDTVIHPGDSAFLGSREGLLPYTWYKLGDTTAIPMAIGTSGIIVRPTVTTSYVLKQELCKVVRWDTIKVWVWPDTPSHVGVEQLALTAIHIYPNPAIEEIIVEGAKGYTVGVFDMLGRCVVPLVAATDKAVLPTHQLAIGVYFVRIIDEVTGEVVVRRVVKE